MAIYKQFNRARMTTATAGTGTITLGSAVARYATFAEAGIGDGDLVTYTIEDGNDFEIGRGTYTASGTTLSRDTVLLSKIGGTSGTTKITLSGVASVFLTAAKEDIEQLSLTNTGLRVRDTNASHLLTIAPGSDLSADRTFTLTTGDGARTLSVLADVTFNVGFTVSTNAGTLVFGAASKTLTVNNSGTFAGGDAFVLAIAAGKTLTASHSLTLAGTDSTTMTFPSTSQSIPGLALNNTWTRGQTITEGTANESIISSTGYSLTGSSAQSVVDCAGTWNTSGTPSGIKLNLTATAHDAASQLINLLTGGTQRLGVRAPHIALGADTTPFLNLVDVWNTSGAAVGIKYNVTATASAAASLLVDLQLGGSSVFKVSKLGVTTMNVGANDAFLLNSTGAFNPTVTVSLTNAPKLIFGVAQAGNEVITGSSAGDSCFRGVTQALLFSGDNGSSVSLKISSDASITVRPAVATPASGSTSARLLFGTTAGFGIYYGSGAPTVSAAKGSWFMRSDGTGVADRAYINTDGGTTWTAVSTVG